MNVRLVAYRKATSGASSTTAYNLDLQEAPNISLNYQFSDIKEPETRKGSFSQTFKLPFTDNNNQFFQDWYNVNLDTLVFNTRTKFDAVLYIGAVPQFEGALQLKSVYKKAQCYEVVLMSSSASLFSTIGEQRLKDVFKEDNGSYSADLNHVYNDTNIKASWDGGSSSFQNAAGTALRDTDFDVQKVMYPISVTREKFYYGSEARYLNLDQTTANTLVSDSGVEAAYDYSVDINQFRPAIQIKYLFDRIMAKAGFSYTSDFISGTGDYSSDKYFGKIFMTTGTALEQSALPTTNTNASPSGVMQVSNNAQWGSQTIAAGTSGCQTFQFVVPANTTSASGTCTTPADPDSIWNTTYNYFTKQDTTMEAVLVRYIPTWSNFENCGGTMTFKAFLREWDTTTNSPTDVIYGDMSDYVYTSVDTASGATYLFAHGLSLEEMPPGKSAQIVIEVGQIQQDNAASSSTITLGNSSAPALGCGTFYNNIRIDWVGYSTNVFGATVDVPACIDADITQRAFLKDIIQRFNLVILTDPNDDTNLIIEPYDDFIASGEIKQWTDKLDTSKEIIVKDTTELQKKTIHLTDQEDVDLYNKSFKERYPELNVFGHLKIDEFNNEFATGELKNESIFSPYINSQVFVTDDEQFGTLLPNMAVQYEFSYETNDGVDVNKIKKTKPKLYWYNGTATNVLNPAGSQVNYYLHRSSNTTLTAYDFNTYPVCTPFDITPSSNVYTLSEDNRSLYWNATPPIVGNLQVFNYQGYIGNWFNKTLYGEWWKPYLDNIYSSEARIMECYLNLNEVDIFDFSFADEIFIKDTYWRILKIQNYQVGAKASTKVTLIKSLDTRSNCNGCDYSIGKVGDSNLFWNTYYLWCPDDNPGCTPVITGSYPPGAYTSPECCTCNGGIVAWHLIDPNTNLYPCIANASSLPLRIKSILSSTNIMSQGQLKTLIYDKLGGRDRPLIRGVNNTKYSQNLLPTYGDDIIIKYKSKNRKTPQYSGENHRITLSGYTVGNTTGYAYPQGDPYGKPLLIPDNVNLLVRVNTLATVVGGTSASYPLGRTEALAYYAAFRITKGQVIRVGTAGGVQEFSIVETGSAGCTMSIQVQANADGQNVLTFGLLDSQTDTKRLWNLKADISVNRINNMNLEYDGNWALFQNGDNILFQNGDYMLWN
jgi:hypothetical protein